MKIIAAWILVTVMPAAVAAMSITASATTAAPETTAPETGDRVGITAGVCVAAMLAFAGVAVTAARRRAVKK